MKLVTLDKLQTLVNQIELRFAAKSDVDVKSTFTIATTDWIADTTFGDYTVKASISVTGITTNDLCDIYYNEASKSVAETAKATGVKTVNGGIEIYAETTPSGDISGTYKIAKVVVS